MNDKLKTLATSATALHSEFGGCSLSLLDGTSPQTGFMVSVADAHVSPYRDLLPWRIADYVRGDNRLSQFRRTNSIHRCYLGTWWDGENSFIDISQRFETLGEALDAGRKNKQIAIYDVANGANIFL